MYRIAKFEKVSYEQFKKDWLDTFGYKYNDDDEEYTDSVIRKIYDSIKLPRRATSGSAGYDFFSPSRIPVSDGTAVKIPTGIRCIMTNGWVLQAYPRSGHGFKTGIHLANTVGIIDEDYAGSSNEGHIFIKLVNDGFAAKHMVIEAGDAFCQCIFVPYGITMDDNVSDVRHGGFGSTGR
ncbi:MAG: hypothetical protein IKW51_08365 [Bacteroidales bacterium]|nr:hypothetical protein [Bacteroidales bacterium]